VTPISLGVLLALATLALALGAVSLRRSRQRVRLLSERLERAASDLQSLQLAFSRFAPEEVIERVITSGVSRIGEKKEVTVLFADLVGFTALSEQVEPAVLVEILNGYFERMSQAISEHRGHVSTFIGDGILAFFGALAPNPWQVNDAVHAALAMRAAMASYNRQLVRDGAPAVSIGIGLHRGSGVAGLVGSGDLMQFAFVGRTVNVAARVQDLTRQYGCDILVTESLARVLDPRFSLHGLPPTAVKGIAQPVSVYAVEGFEPDRKQTPAGGA
jgi:class 3 adenylate cyclase